MKQRQGQMGTINENIPINSNDFLTGEDIQQTPVSNSFQTPPPPNLNSGTTNDIPDLEKMESVPNVSRRQEINQMVDENVVAKVTSIEDQIQNDIKNAQKKKFEGKPTHPKDVLKQLIAQGEYVEDFRLFGHVWTLRALDQGDQLMSLDEVKDSIETASGRVVAMMFGSVVFSVQAIDGLSIYEWFDEIKITNFENNMEYHIAIRKAFKKYLEAMPPTVIESLYEKYMELDDKRNEAVNELKN